MAVKVTRLRLMLWKLKAYYQQHSLVPPAFWVGFWFANGVYWAVLLIGFAANVARFARGLFGLEV